MVRKRLRGFHPRCSHPVDHRPSLRGSTSTLPFLSFTVAVSMCFAGIQLDLDE